MSARRFPPSARRLDETRRAGNVAVSPALLRGAAALALLATLALLGDRAGERLLALARHAFAPATPAGRAASLAAASAVLEATGAEAWGVLVAVLVPLLVAMLAVVLLVGLAQTRAVFTTAVFGGAAPRGRDSPWGGVLMGALLVVAAAIALSAELRALAVSPSVDGEALLGRGIRALGRVAWRVALVGSLLGLADYVLLQLRWRRALWMTRGEVELERRESEGDPRLRSERTRRARTPSMGDPVALLDTCELVLIGDGHALGLRRVDRRVYIVCRAAGLVAARLIAEARRRRIPVRSDELVMPDLWQCEVGAAVPSGPRPRVAATLAALADRRPAGARSHGRP